MRRQDLIAIAVIIALVVSVAGYLVYQQMIPAAGIVSSVEVSELRISPDGTEILSGYWLVTLIVDQRDEMIFSIRPEEASADLEEDPEHNIPPGSKIQSKKGISVVIRPLGDPYVHGPVRRAGIAYDDTGYTPKTRLWEYYSLASPSWTGVHVPYQVIVTDLATGSVLADESFLSGGTDWDMREKILLPHGMELMNLGQLWSGLLPPSADLAYIFNVDGAPQFVEESDIQSLFLANRPGPRKMDISVSATSTQYDHEGKFDLDKNDKTWWFYDDWSGLFNNAEAWLDVIDVKDDGTVVVELYFWDEVFSRDYDFTTVFSVAGTGGFIPDKYRVKTTDFRAGIEVDEGTFDVVGGEAKLEWWGSGFAWGTSIVEIKFFGAADTWNEFCYQTKIGTLTSDPTAGARIVTEPNQVPLKPAWVDLWKGTPSLYTTTIPETEYRAGTFPSVDTGGVVVWSLPGTSVRAFLQLKAPTDVFDSVIFRPPFGDPDIVEVSDVTIAGGGQATIVAKIKNVGYTEDTLIPSLDLPRGMYVISYPGDKSVPVDGPVEFKWVVAVGDVESDRTESATLRVVAKNSLLDDDYSFTVNLKKSPGPIIYTGDLTVYVIDAETELTLQGAEVGIAGLKAVTGIDGSATVNDIREGDQRLTVSLEDYVRYSEDIHIYPGLNERTVRLSKVVPPWFPTELLLGIGIAIPAVIGVVLVGKRQGWWLRGGFKWRK